MSTSAVESRPVPVRGLPDPGERVPPIAWPTVALYIGSLLLFGVEMYGLFVAGWSPFLTVAIGVVVSFLMFSVLHEATHHAVSTNTKVNNFFGHISIPFFVAWANFPLLKFIHIEHHRNTNEVKSIDPDAWCEEGPRWQLPFRWATIDIWYLIFYARRLRDRPAREVVLSLTVLGGVLGSFVAITALGYGTELLLAYLLPQRIGLFVLAWWFDYLPHNGLEATQREDRYRATRVRVGAEGILTPLFVYQNYHLVHHLHPSVPFYRYIRAWRRNEQAYLDRNAAISTWFGRSLSASEYRTWRRLTEQPDVGHRPTFFSLRVSDIERLTTDSVAITFDVPRDLVPRFQYLQGQHITVRAIVDGQEVRRSYSLVAPVSSQTIRIAVREVEDGALSSHLNRNVAVGDLLDVMTPTGAFWVDLEPNSERSYVAVAAGSGITVMMSTIATTLEVEPESRFTLVYGNRTSNSTMFRDELARMEQEAKGRLVVHHVLSREDADRPAARIDVDTVRELVGDPSAVHTWYLCGPEPLVADLQEALADEPGAVLSELFRRDTTEHHADIDVDLVSEVLVTLDGVDTTISVSSTGEPILDAALQAGIDAPYSCAGGACGTCRAKVLLGRAVMDQNHVLSDQEVADGHVLTCQAHPVTESVHIEY